jgi:chromosome segregation ATPase
MHNTAHAISTEPSPLRVKIDAELSEAATALPTLNAKVDAAQQALATTEAELQAFRNKFRPVEERLAQSERGLAAPLLNHRKELDSAAHEARSALRASLSERQAADTRLKNAREADAQLRAVGE